ncbi:hypothetical protein RR48_00945 [Papilio machaon]|uniref:Uncharacterized protein n=1 Tax=Papilio machaon TaxID=76193 RepID=A0A0N1PKJ7_PAPMA|nr:hypothetical protein RR48_00945 [Papilio machaon]
MEFDLKTACGFIPILDGKEDTVKQLIDAVEMYSEMLSEGDQEDQEFPGSKKIYDMIEDTRIQICDK